MMTPKVMVLGEVKIFIFFERFLDFSRKHPVKSDIIGLIEKTWYSNKTKFGSFDSFLQFFDVQFSLCRLKSIFLEFS